MQERALLRGWIERRSTEHYYEADNPIQVLGTALCVYGNPTASAYEQRGVLAALALRVLTKPNRSRTARSRKSSPIK
jgi:hypothetical protein